MDKAYRGSKVLIDSRLRDFCKNKSYYCIRYVILDLIFKANRDIPAGEELSWEYNKKVDEKKPWTWCWCPTVMRELLASGKTKDGLKLSQCLVGCNCEESFSAIDFGKPNVDLLKIEPSTDSEVCLNNLYRCRR